MLDVEIETLEEEALVKFEKLLEYESDMNLYISVKDTADMHTAFNMLESRRLKLKDGILALDSALYKDDLVCVDGIICWIL